MTVSGISGNMIREQCGKVGPISVNGGVGSADDESVCTTLGNRNSLLFIGTADGAVGAKNAAVAKLGLQELLTLRAFIEMDTRVRRYGFFLTEPAVWTRDDGLQDYIHEVFFLCDDIVISERQSSLCSRTIPPRAGKNKLRSRYCSCPSAASECRPAVSRRQAF
jgi:hypothetical protein